MVKFYFDRTYEISGTMMGMIFNSDTLGEACSYLEQVIIANDKKWAEKEREAK